MPDNFQHYVKYRSSTDILAQMLECASKSALSKTKLRYAAFVPHERMNEFTDLLVHHGLLGFDHATRQYQTTGKGLKFLDSYEKLNSCQCSV